MTGPGLLRWGDVAIGAAARTGESATGVVTRLRSRWQNDMHSLRERLAELPGRLAERGAAQRSRGVHLLDEALTALATAPLLDRIVDAQVERVLQLLENEPERIHTLVRGQRDTIVDEVVGRIRAGAAAGDEAVEKFTLKRGRREPTDWR